jgi:virulence-associated protein VagC
MSHKVKLCRIRDSQVLRLPKAFRFEGDTVVLRRTNAGVLISPAKTSAAQLRARLLAIAARGSGDFPDSASTEAANPTRRT